MNQYVFSGVPDHHWSNMSTNISTNISAASSAAASAPSPKERLSVSLDVNSMYGTSPNPIHTESILKKKWLNQNLSPQRKSEKRKKLMHYVPKWSSKMYGLYTKNKNLLKRNPTQDKWNGMPVLTLNTIVGAGLKQLQNEDGTKYKKGEEQQQTFVNGKYSKRRCEQM